MILECLDELDRDRREQSNIAAYVHAVGWSGLFNGFAGGEGKKTSPVDLLPFKPEEEQNKKISDRTRCIIVESIKAKKIPPQMAAAFTLLLE
jgi:hypothetical protein